MTSVFRFTLVFVAMFVGLTLLAACAPRRVPMTIPPAEPLDPSQVLTPPVTADTLPVAPVAPLSEPLQDVERSHAPVEVDLLGVSPVIAKARILPRLLRGGWLVIAHGPDSVVVERPGDPAVVEAMFGPAGRAEPLVRPRLVFRLAARDLDTRVSLIGRLVTDRTGQTEELQHLPAIDLMRRNIEAMAREEFGRWEPVGPD